MSNQINDLQFDTFEFLTVQECPYELAFVIFVIKKSFLSTGSAATGLEDQNVGLVNAKGRTQTRIEAAAEEAQAL